MNSTLSPASRNEHGDLALSPCSPSYYAVYLGSPDPGGDVKRHVYSDKKEALKIAKQCKKSRFKGFCSFEEAENFAVSGPDFICSPGTPFAPEGASPFKAPISQESVKFRKSIEKGDLEDVKRTVTLNPRYLVSSGDTPAILQEGARYNALHVAAKFDRPKICEYILHCVSDPEFIMKLYGEDKMRETVKQRCDVLIDLYLNTPDKAANETPLHFASKMGAVDVVKVLVSYEQCDKSRKNKQGETALDVVGSRKSNLSKEEKSEIIRILSNEYYVAVFRPLDPVRPAIIEGPFLMTSPSKPKLKSLLESEMRMSGVAGPMKLEEAVNFKKLWKRPRGSPLTSPSSPRSPPVPLAFSPSSFRKPDKVIERIGRELCSEMGVYWMEYWPFLKDFANFQKEKDLNLLEKHLANRFDYIYGKNFKRNANNCPESIIDDCLDNLTVDLSKMSLASSVKSDSKNNNVVEFKGPANSYLHIEKTCQVYANKLVESLNSMEFHCFLSALNRCHNLLMSCVTDKRYTLIEFNRIHSKVAALVKQKIYEDNPASVPDLIIFLNKFIEKEGACLISSIHCISQNILSALLGSSNDVPVTHIRGSSTGANEESVKSTWLSLESCTCLIDTKDRAIKKRLNFGNRLTEEDEWTVRTEKVGAINSFSVNKVENKILFDNNDSDVHFRTPPSSPGSDRFNHNTTLSTSDEDSSSEDEMHSADEGVPIAIEGDCLTDIDKAVYESLDRNKISLTKHPFIYLWLQDCKRKFTCCPSTPLVFSPLSPIYKKMCEDLKLNLRHKFSKNL